MKPIASAIAQAIKGQNKKGKKITNLASYKEQIDQANKISEEIDSIQKKLENSKSDPQHAYYIAYQNLTSIMAELLCLFPEMRRHAQFIAKAEDEYWPSWPPMSPVSCSAFFMWSTFDLYFGKGCESIGSCLFDLSEVFAFPQLFSKWLRTCMRSRLGIYTILSSDGEMHQLEELFTGKSFLAHAPGITGTLDTEIWLTRLLPPVMGDLGYHTAFTSPYVSMFSADEWLRYFDRNVKGVRGSEFANKQYSKHMKYGRSHLYWLEFIMQAYSRHTDEKIMLFGVPDLAKTRPHFHDNKILT